MWGGNGGVEVYRARVELDGAGIGAGWGHYETWMEPGSSWMEPRSERGGAGQERGVQGHRTPQNPSPEAPGDDSCPTEHKLPVEEARAAPLGSHLGVSVPMMPVDTGAWNELSLQAAGMCWASSICHGPQGGTGPLAGSAAAHLKESGLGAVCKAAEPHGTLHQRQRETTAAPQNTSYLWRRQEQLLWWFLSWCFSAGDTCGHRSMERGGCDALFIAQVELWPLACSTSGPKALRKSSP
ncbi:uncharacterized protein AAGF69_017580 [Amazona ochrocephala]